jgi:hypothetical protein
MPKETFSIRTIIVSPLAARGAKKNTWGTRSLTTQFDESEENAKIRAQKILESVSCPYRGKIVVVVGPVSWVGEKRPETRFSKGEQVVL